MFRQQEELIVKFPLFFFTIVLVCMCLPLLFGWQTQLLHLVCGIVNMFLFYFICFEKEIFSF